MCLLPVTSDIPTCSIAQMSSLGDEQYFFDSIRSVTESRRRSRRLREGEQDVGEAVLVRAPQSFSVFMTEALTSQVAKPTWPTWWWWRGSSGSMWPLAKFWWQTWCFTSHRYSGKWARQIYTLVLSRWFFQFCIDHALQTGAVQVPAWLPQLHQTGHDRPWRAAVQSSGGFRQDAVQWDPQATGGPGPCRPNQDHAGWRLEDGKTKTEEYAEKTMADKPLLMCILRFNFIFLSRTTAHRLLLQPAQWNHSAGGQNHLPGDHCNLANFRLHLLRR